MLKVRHILWWMLPVAVCVATGLASCSSTKHVPDGQMLLDHVNIRIKDPTHGSQTVETAPLYNYLQQTENHRVLGGLKLQLGVYNLSGRDSTNWFNRWIRRLGSAPVIYDSTLTQASVQQLHTALHNSGYINNVISYDVHPDSARKKVTVDYNITLNEPYYVNQVSYDISNDTLRDLIVNDPVPGRVHPGDLLNYTLLDGWRQAITEQLRNRGYYAFNKEYISFLADTVAGSKAVDLTLTLREPLPIERMPYYTTHRPFYVRRVTYVTNYDPVAMQDGYYGTDSTQVGGVTVLSDRDYIYLRNDVIDECNHIEPGRLYRLEDVNRTYQALGRLNVVKSVNIAVQPVGEIDGDIWVDAYVLLQPDKAQSVSASLEGTNSEGDLGFGIGLDYEHRNVFHGAETLNTKFRLSYQSISGNLNGLINDNYSEYATEVGLTFPKFHFPFLKRSFKKKIQASTEVALNFDYQSRPEYTRILAGAALRYNWTERHNQTRHSLNLLDVSFVSVPKSDPAYFDSISNPLLRYSYEDHLIMRLGYNFYHTNKREMSPLRPRSFQSNVYTVRAAAETAGNVLYGISNIVGQHREADDNYKVLGIRYAQYVKAEGDYAITHYFDSRQSLAFHVGAGVAVPYGNASVLPFEKRFYAGGANGVRGWGVRTLGPGSYNSHNDQRNFIYQCGDIRFDVNLEYRAKLFWVIELGLFVDAGNIWTIRDYVDQAGGVFKFNKFYEQIAASYGLGLRLDFNYFLLRVDMGVKAHNPASGQEHWPMFSPRFKRDCEFHFSVGYPF